MFAILMEQHLKMIIRGTQHQRCSVRVIQVHCDRSVYLSDESLQPTDLLERDYVVVIIFYFFGNNPVHCTFIQDASYHTFSITIRNHSLKGIPLSFIHFFCHGITRWWNHKFEKKVARKVCDVFKLENKGRGKCVTFLIYYLQSFFPPVKQYSNQLYFNTLKYLSPFLIYYLQSFSCHSNQLYFNTLKYSSP